jgi:hypothetical protein
MPADRVPSSTRRRRELAQAIELFGEVMVKKCSNCVSRARVCKVSVRSGKCGECLARGARCDVAVTRNEFSRLVAEKRRLDAQIKEAREEQDKAFEALRVARAKEDRLSKQLALNAKRAEEAIAVESLAVAELDEDPAEPVWPQGPSELIPGVWSAWDGLDPSFFETSSVVVGLNDGIAPEAGGSS